MKVTMKRMWLAMMIICLSQVSAWAGVVKGKVTDKSTGEHLIGATVGTADGKLGATVNMDGEYEFSLPEGSYVLLVRYVGYKMISKEVLVTDGTLTMDFQLEEVNETLENVVVKGEIRYNTEASVLREQQQSNVTMTGVSEQQIKKTQDKNAGEVIRRIPGISIIDDKFVMVRGLSQRYNNVWLNGAAVPSSEADQRAFSFDIIPSSQLDNMKVVKSAAPDYPADFSGGFIMVNTKDVPIQNSWNVSLGGTVNTITHGNELVLPKESGTDFLGFDNGLRKLNGGIHARLNEQLNGVSLLGNGLSNDWLPNSRKPLLDMSLMADVAHRWVVGQGHTLGLMGSMSYTNSYQWLKDMDNNMFGAYDVTNNQSNFLRRSVDQQYNHDVKLGAMLSLVWLSSNANHRIELKQIFNQFGKNRYTYRRGYDAQSDYMEQAEYYYQNRLTYNLGMNGRHSLTDADQLKWNLGYAFANRNLPDRRRYTVFEQENGSLEIENLNDLNREFSNLGEHIYSASADWQRKFQVGDWIPSLKMGGYGEYRNRKYDTRFFTYAWPNGQLSQQMRSLDVTSQLLVPENYGEHGLYLLEQIDWSNNYEARGSLGSGYISLHLPFFGNKLEAYGGVRFEHYRTELISHVRRQEYSPTSTFYTYDDFFPSLNLTYHLNDKQQLRLAYGRTTNRPEFRELSTSVYYDFDLASNVQGNHRLRPAYMNNLDFGWELYPRAGEVISVSCFYKHFRNPIEWTYTVSGGTDLVYSYLNAEGAKNFGMEIDIRKQLDFIRMPQFSLSANMSWIHSRVSFPAGSKESNRPMQGQSPYLVNIGVFYNGSQGRTMADTSKEWTVSMLYNVIGKRIIGVGRNIGTGEVEVRVPDSYEMPRHQLNINIGKQFGNLGLRFSIRDLLGQKVQFKQFEGNAPRGKTDQITRSYRPGQAFSLTVTYKL